MTVRNEATGGRGLGGNRCLSLLAAMSGFLLFLLIIPLRDEVDPVLTSLGALWLGPSGRAIIIFSVPILLSTAILVAQHRSVGSALEELGLTGSIKTGFVFGFLATLPALVGFALTATITGDLSLYDVLYKSVFGPICEEVLFRAVGFGLLYRRAGLGFWPAAILPSLVFGGMHIHSDTPVSEVLGVFAVTGLGGLLFSYVFVRFAWNLWAPIALHVLLNLLWGVFDVSHNALGGWLDNGFRLASVAFAFGIMFVAGRKAKWAWLAPTRTGWRKAPA